MNDYNPGTWIVEAGGSGGWGQTCLVSKLKKNTRISEILSQRKREGEGTETERQRQRIWIPRIHLKSYGSMTLVCLFRERR